MLQSLAVAIYIKGVLYVQLMRVAFMLTEAAYVAINACCNLHCRSSLCCNHCLLQFTSEEQLMLQLMHVAIYTHSSSLCCNHCLLQYTLEEQFMLQLMRVAIYTYQNSLRCNHCTLAHLRSNTKIRRLSVVKKCP